MIKRLEELNAIDNFMFNELVMQEDEEKSKQFCRTLLEPILNRKIRDIEIVPQKVYQGTDTDRHGIMLDAYVKETVNADGVTVSDVKLNIVPNIFVLEPNNYKENSYKELLLEAKRNRYYHSITDSHVFKSGSDYSKLPNVIVIMILTHDPFGLDRMMYTIENHCVEEPDMEYYDGAKTIYLYTRGTKEIPSQSLKNMLSFLEESSSENATETGLMDVKNMMDTIKHDHKIGVKYMHTYEREQAIRREGEIEGYKAGEADGLIKGEAKGVNLLSNAIKLAKENSIKTVNELTKQGFSEEVAKAAIELL